jgi:hypothetical protein
MAKARTLLTALDESDLPMAEFAREHDLPAGALYTANRERRSAQVRPVQKGLHELTVVHEHDPTPKLPAKPIELALPSGLVLRVPDCFDEVALRRLLGVLAAC